MEQLTGDHKSKAFKKEIVHTHTHTHKPQTSGHFVKILITI